MAQIGWVSIHRSVVDNFVHDDKPFCFFGAWIDLILMANHEDKKILVNRNLMTVKRGQLFTSVRKLAERWGWGTKKTLRFLNVLVDEQMLVKESTQNATLLTVVKYDFFQNCGNTDDYTDDHTDATPTTTPTQHRRPTNNKYNNDNKDNNDNKVIKKKSTPERYFPDDDLLEETFRQFREMRKTIKAPMSPRAIELMVSKISRLPPDEAVKQMEQSIINGWKDIYPVKGKKKGGDPFGGFDTDPFGIGHIDGII